MSDSAAPDLVAFWNYVSDQTKARIALPALYRALEAATPLAIEGELLILGVSPAQLHMSGLLTDYRNKNVIEQILEAASGRRLRIQVIPGDRPEDWQDFKAAQAEGLRMQQLTKRTLEQAVEAGQTWEAVGEQLTRKFAAVNNRALSAVQGQFLAEAVDILAEAYGRLMTADPAEADLRAYSRVLDRLSERVQVNGSMIAYLVHTRRSR